MTTNRPLGDALTGRSTPAAFLTEVLPGYARRQRLDAMLAEVTAAESASLAALTEVIALLNRAVGLRERLEKALERAGGPLSATESAESAPLVCPDPPEALGPDLGVFRNPEIYALPAGYGLSRPGPY